MTDLQINEALDPSGASRLALEGELDLATVDDVRQRLRELAAAELVVKVDLSGLEFMDSSGISLLVEALTDTRSNGWQLEIDTNLNHQVARLIDVAGVGEFFWPQTAMTPGQVDHQHASAPKAPPERFEHR